MRGCFVIVESGEEVTFARVPDSPRAGTGDGPSVGESGCHTRECRRARRGALARMLPTASSGDAATGSSCRRKRAARRRASSQSHGSTGTTCQGA